MADTRDTLPDGLHPLMAVAARPFFLLAALLACLWIPLSRAFYFGKVVTPGSWGPIGWHSHEMIYGYALAVIAGFLLTSARVWTGRETAYGARLSAVVMLWLLGRAAVLVGGRIIPVFTGNAVHSVGHGSLFHCCGIDGDESYVSRQNPSCWACIGLGLIARGHAERPLILPVSAVAAIVLLIFAILARVAVPLVLPDWYVPGLFIAAGSWTAAFTLYLWGYFTILISPRVDGRLG